MKVKYRLNSYEKKVCCFSKITPYAQYPSELVKYNLNELELCIHDFQLIIIHIDSKNKIHISMSYGYSLQISKQLFYNFYIDEIFCFFTKILSYPHHIYRHDSIQNIKSNILVYIRDIVVFIWFFLENFLFIFFLCIFMSCKV